jgi:Ser/Thr protein kinase RdoA (MazF antagonist)
MPSAQPFTGWLDFDIATWGARVFDLAYCSTSLLSAAGDDDTLRARWFSLLSALVGGYEAVQPLQAAERALFWHVQVSIQVIFMAFFMEAGRPDLVAENYRALRWLDAHRGQVEGAVAPTYGGGDGE